MSKLDPTWKKQVVYDIKHQDVYYIYNDLSGNTFNEEGRPINLQQMLSGPEEYDWDTPAQFGIYEVKEAKKEVKKEEGKWDMIDYMDIQ